MKKQLFVFLVLSLIIGKVSAQLTLAHTFDGAAEGGFSYVEEYSGYYYFADDNTNTLYLYNSNYSLYKTISLNLPPGYSISIFSIRELGKHLINTDDKMEFFVYCSNINVSQNLLFYAIIINEEGSIIKDFGYSYRVSTGGVYKVGNQLRLSLLKAEYVTLQNYQYQINYQTEVYICHGDYNAVTSFENKITKMQPYPNPTTTLINLPYHIEKGTVSTIKIYNINGQLVDSYNIGGDFEMITIDVNNYAKGIYVYEYNGISNRFVVQ